MKKTILYLSLLLLTQCSKCKTDDPAPKEPQLPAETQSGQRTLGCKVNGKVFATRSTTRVNATWGCIDCFYVGAGTEGADGLEFSMDFRLRGENIEGAVFQLVSVPPAMPPAKYGAAAATTQTCDYEVIRLINGQVTLTRFDAAERIAAGRFSFTLYKPGCDTLRVTDGRFDVRF